MIKYRMTSIQELISPYGFQFQFTPNFWTISTYSCTYTIQCIIRYRGRKMDGWKEGEWEGMRREAEAEDGKEKERKQERSVCDCVFGNLLLFMYVYVYLYFCICAHLYVCVFNMLWGTRKKKSKYVKEEKFKNQNDEHLKNNLWRNFQLTKPHRIIKVQMNRLWICLHTFRDSFLELLS